MNRRKTITAKVTTVGNSTGLVLPKEVLAKLRVSKGDVVRRELLGCTLRKLVEQGVVEPMVATTPTKRVQATLM